MNCPQCNKPLRHKEDLLWCDRCQCSWSASEVEAAAQRSQATKIRTLTAEVERLNEENDALRIDIELDRDAARSSVHGYIETIDSISAEVERLRERWEEREATILMLTASGSARLKENSRLAAEAERLRTTVSHLVHDARMALGDDYLERVSHLLAAIDRVCGGVEADRECHTYETNPEECDRCDKCVGM